MDALQALIWSVGLATGLAAATVLLLYGPFRGLLVDLCRSEIHGRFWLVFTSVAIVLTTLFGALAGWRDGVSLELVVATFRAGLLGLLLSLASVALVVLASIGQRRMHSEPPRIP